MSNITRTRKSERKYVEFRKQNAEEKDGSSCDLCKYIPGTKIVHRGKTMNITAANFPYDFWDSTGVAEHLMILPKRHVNFIHELNPSERDEYLDILSEYEQKGYCIYSRGNAVATRSRTHLHTHLILLDGKHKKIVFYIRKPHMNFMR